MIFPGENCFRWNKHFPKVSIHLMGNADFQCYLPQNLYLTAKLLLIYITQLLSVKYFIFFRLRYAFASGSNANVEKDVDCFVEKWYPWSVNWFLFQENLWRYYFETSWWNSSRFFQLILVLCWKNLKRWYKN